MKWPDERPCKDNTAHEKGTGYTASSARAAQVHLRERELRSFYCESKVFTLTGQVSNPDPSTQSSAHRPLGHLFSHETLNKFSMLQSRGTSSTYMYLFLYRLSK